MRKEISDHYFKSGAFFLKTGLLLLMLLFLGRCVAFLPSRLGPILRTAVVIWLFIELSCFFLHFILRNPFLRSEFIRNIYCFAWVTVVLFLICEAVFACFLKSHGSGFSLNSRLWFQTYWLENKLGYRDKDIQKEDSEKKKIMILGDSFTAGHGLKKTGDRYGDLLQNQLSQTRVFNLGKNGADTIREYKNLLNFPLNPDILILQYFGNDIEGAAQSHLGRKEFTPYEDVPFFLKPLVGGSFFLNYLYWLFPHQDANAYYDYFVSCYRDAAILRDHFRDLQKFVEYAKAKRISLIVVIFPFMEKEDMNSEYVPLIENYFRSQNVQVINVAGLAAGLPVKKRIVNTSDEHASQAVQRLVADALYSILKDEFR